MINTKRIVYVLICFSLWLTSLQTAYCSGPDEPLVKANNWEITQDYLTELMKIMPEAQKAALRQDPVKLKKFVKRLAETRAIAEYAKKEGFLEMPGVRAELERMQNEVLSQLYIRQALKNAGEGITDKDIEQYYKANRNKFRTSDQVRLRVIKFPVGKYATKETISKIFDKVQHIKDELKKGGKFPELAKKYNVIPEIKEKAGDIGWVRVNGLTPELATVINHTKNRQYFGPVRTEKGVYFGRVEGRKKGKVIPLSQVRGDIRNKLVEERRRNLAISILNEALAAEGVKINTDRLLGLFN